MTFGLTLKTVTRTQGNNKALKDGSVKPRTCELALEQLASKRFPLERITTHRFGLKDVDLAIRSVGGHGVPDVIHASLMPWM